MYFYPSVYIFDNPYNEFVVVWSNPFDIIGHVSITECKKKIILGLLTHQAGMIGVKYV